MRLTVPMAGSVIDAEPVLVDSMMELTRGQSRDSRARSMVRSLVESRPEVRLQVAFVLVDPCGWLLKGKAVQPRPSRDVRQDC